jgi:hypothetical protein
MQAYCSQTTALQLGATRRSFMTPSGRCVEQRAWARLEWVVHRRLHVELVKNSKPPRRWSKRRLVVVVSSLIAVSVLLALSVVGFAHSLGFVINAADAIGDVGEIAPEHAAPTGNAVTVGSPVSTVTETSPAPSGSGSGASPSALPAMEASAAPIGGMSQASGSGGAPVKSDTLAQTGGGAGAGSTDGVAGSATSAWDDAVQGALGLISQNTISMCGRNTCNVGQVCCNASCGVCVAAGSSCDKQQCPGAPRAPTAIRCGNGQCNDGQVCCNASCGICAAPGETCSDKKCQ